MIKRYNKQHHVFLHKAGDVVLLKVPPKLASLSPTPPITCIVQSPAFNNTYSLYCRHGLLNRHYHASCLKSVSPLLWPSCTFTLLDKKVSLRGSLLLMTSSTVARPKACSCKRSCGKRCGCHTAGHQCTSICHSLEAPDCGNMQSEVHADGDATMRDTHETRQNNAHANLK
jgi:hypothetical protein